MTVTGDAEKGCCLPQRDAAQRVAPTSVSPATARDDGARWVRIDGCTFLMGANDPAAHPLDGEGPVRAVRLDPFWIDAVAVSNRRFARFVAATGHVTEAERFGWSFVFKDFLPADHRPADLVPGAP